jgi:hypothetical protein
MDVYHKVLTKIYEETGGRETVDVDLTDLLKREGFYPSIADIAQFLAGESWVTETSKQYVVRITHWGVAEAKKSLAGTPDKAQLLERDSKRLTSLAKEFLVMVEEFAGSPEKAKFQVVSQKSDELEGIMTRIEKNL